MDDSIDSSNFSVSGYLPLIQKDSVTHRHALAGYVKEGRPFAQNLLIFSTGFTSFSVLLIFPLSITFFVLMHSFRCFFI